MNCLASQSDPKRSGNAGPYFNVLNNDSEYGLSLDTRGRECDRVTSRSASSAATVLLVIDVPRMLSCVSRGLAELLGRWSGGWCASAVGTAGDSGLSGVEQEIDFTGEIALEASDGLEFGVALGGLLGYVGLGFRVQ